MHVLLISSGGVVYLGLALLAPGCGRSDKMSVMLGGADAMSVIRSPEKVELFPSLYTYWMETNPAGPMPPNPIEKAGPGTNLPPATVSELTQLLLNPQSYLPKTNYLRNDVFEPEVILRFTKRKKIVELVLSIGSGHALLQTGPTEKDVDLFPVRNELARITRPYLNKIPYTWRYLFN